MTELGIFDRFADTVSRFTSKAWFFAICLLIVLLWAPSILIIQSIDTWQLVINTTTTIVTFLLVALQQNASSRSNAALHIKLNAMSEGIADLLDDVNEHDADVLRAAVGLENRQSSTDIP